MIATQEEEILDQEIRAARKMQLHYSIEPRTKEIRALLEALSKAGYTTTLGSFYSRQEARVFAKWLYSRRYGIEAQAAAEFVKYLQDLDREED